LSTPLTSTEWVSVLKLSTIWGFHSVKATAMDNLATFANDDPVLKVVVAKKYNIPDWFVSGLNALVQRTEPLAFADFERFKEIGSSDYVVDFFIRVSRVRESYTSTSQSGYCRYHECACQRSGATTQRSSYDFSASVRDVFAADITSLGAPSTDGTGSSTSASPNKKKKKGRV
jgi:hypothetical protein